MTVARKMHAHSELVWWLLLMLSAVALAGMLAREARGRWWDQVGATRIVNAAVDLSPPAIAKG